MAAFEGAGGGPMGWVYRRRRFGGCLALAALALQLVLTFGHVHLDGVHRLPPAALAGAAAQVSQSAPVPHPGADADGYCAICATIYLAATTFLPQPPQLPPPFVARSIAHFDQGAIGFIAPRRTLFQSRAPPLA